ncbi:hypothetical protein BC936DRAFT_148046 [Jimgerdemannia flammicorona]|uniref:Uncharacterized protein n=1 Tax=Jimgerdemannia flammicorona TaxID=994334 RepID=A0A433D3W4_9FUNG|nr:hypothetical protein BC936DRAFT_148046 [Jimgerdemannia flammicorona]
MSIEDVVHELRARVLTEAEMVLLLKWWTNVNAPNAVTEPTLSDLLDLAINDGPLVADSVLAQPKNRPSEHAPSDNGLAERVCYFSPEVMISR